MNNPFNLEQGDLLKSTIASSFMKIFFMDSDSLANIDYNADIKNIESQLQQTKSTRYRDMYLQELLSQIEIHKLNGKTDKISKLIKIYE